VQELKAATRKGRSKFQEAPVKKISIIPEKATSPRGGSAEPCKEKDVVRRKKGATSSQITEKKDKKSVNPLESDKP